MSSNDQFDKLRNMVLAFRMSELQTLMVFAGRSKTGRKQDLQTKAVELCKLNANDINIKIKELNSSMYRSIGPTSGSSSPPESYSSSPSTSSTSRPAPTYTNPVNIPILPNPTPTQSSHHLSYPTYPDVSLKKLPFYRQEETLLKPCSLQPTGSARFQEQKFSFILKPSEATAISSSQRKVDTRLEYRTQIQMRFSLLETSCEQDDNFPSSICVKVNGKLCPLPNPIPTNKPGAEPVRPPRPINITPLCKLSSTAPNYIDVSWAVEVGRAHTISVYMVESLNYKDLLTQLTAKGQRQPDYTRALIKEKLADQDQEIATTSCKVTLACPLGKMRMVNPARASTCDHLQCFDAQLYLSMNERKPKWVCPVCNKPALMENLLVDGFFMELMASPRLPADEHEIVLHNDGTWDPLPPKIPDHLRMPQGGPRPASYSLDSDDEACGSSRPQGHQGAGARTDSRLSSNSSSVDCITLDTSEDEDEGEEPQAKRSRVGGDGSPLTVSSTSSPSVFQTPGSPDCITIDDD